MVKGLNNAEFYHKRKSRKERYIMLLRSSYVVVKFSAENKLHAPVAQWTEHLTSDQTVPGSNPGWGAII